MDEFYPQGSVKRIKMIRDKREIRIDAPPEAVFDLIETMPNKFPVYSILETKPFLFLRILLVDGMRAAKEAITFEKAEDSLNLKVGESMGPFTLWQSEKPAAYLFSLNSFFFNCQTGYSLVPSGSGTVLSFDLTSDTPAFRERIYWYLIKPMHLLLARKVLRVIKKKAEGGETN
jgi:hypothetical protein